MLQVLADDLLGEALRVVQLHVQFGHHPVLPQLHFLLRDHLMEGGQRTHHIFYGRFGVVAAGEHLDQQRVLQLGLVQHLMVGGVDGVGPRSAFPGPTTHAGHHGSRDYAGDEACQAGGCGAGQEVDELRLHVGDAQLGGGDPLVRADALRQGRGVDGGGGVRPLVSSGTGQSDSILSLRLVAVPVPESIL